MAGLTHKDQRWYAVYTRSKGEKAAFRSLQQEGIHTYLPLMKKVRMYNRKRKEVELPLITCYVFVKISKEEYVKVLQCPNVVNFVRFSSEIIPIPDFEIDLMKRILGEGWEVELKDCDFSLGDLVEISAGNLTGTQGYIVGNPEDRQVLVNLKHIGMGLQITVDRNLLIKAQK